MKDDYEKMREQIRKEIGTSPPKSEYKYKWKCGICGSTTFSKNKIKECIYKCKQ